MKSRSGHRRSRHGALALAIVAGAGLAGGYVTVQKGAAASAEGHADTAEVAHTRAGAAGQGSSAQPDAAPSSTAPALPPSVMPFNAKLTSKDIPVEGGGVRGGGCSGSLIAPDWIITAGHCFHDLDGTRVGGAPQYHMTVAVGKINDDDPRGHVVQAVDVRQSPVNDLALVKLSAPITDIAPLTLPTGPPKVGEDVDFVGWGSLSATVVAPADHMKRGHFEVSDIRHTELDMSPREARTVENSPCHDDSGSPFFVPEGDQKGRLVAVEDNGPDCPQPGVETTARVDTILDWIHEQMS
ncbi:trypsin-like serine protease [Amycolatopsis sp. NPDC047767]|uniref:trypsin-like serine protease n=1 Tax=Amycolatopsis sp. NPDC047767 TaxID=3156765 RepID=UPI0034528035